MHISQIYAPKVIGLGIRRLRIVLCETIWLTGSKRTIFQSVGINKYIGVQYLFDIEEYTLQREKTEI